MNQAGPSEAHGRDRRRSVLFLCTGNSARSILGEYLLRTMDDRFESYSAGAAPTGEVHPVALRVLREGYGIEAEGARSKSFASLADVDLDIVITVCDNARDHCPILPSSSAIQAHWGSPDPAAVAGSDEEIEVAFRQVADQIHRRIELFSALPFDQLDRDQLTEQLRSIGDARLS